MDKQGISGRERLALILERFIHLGLYLVLCSPLLMWSGFLYPHLTAKILGLHVLVELVFAAFVIVILLKEPKYGKMQDLLHSPLIVMSAAVFAYSLLTAILGVDLNQSLWGYINRQDGLVLQLHLLAWTVVTVWFYGCAGDHFQQAHARHPIKSSRFHSYLHFSFWVSVVAALTAFGDTEVRFEGIVRSMRAILSSATRPSGVFGNPAFLGSYLLLHFFFGFYLLLKWRRPGAHHNPGEDAAAKRSLRHRASRYARLLGLVLGLAIIAFTIVAGQTRGVMIALVLGLLAIGSMLVLGRFTGRLFRVAGLVFAAGIILAAVLTWQQRESPIVRQIQILQRLTHISATSDPSTAMRLLSWGSGLRSALDHPLLGWGHNNAYYALNKYYDPRQITYTPFVDVASILWFDKSHNYFLDLLIERGVMGVLLYFLLLGVIARSLWRLADRHLAFCMAGALISYLISNAVAFDNFGSLFGFFLALACVASVADPEPMLWLRSRPDHRRNVSKSEKKKVSRAPGFPVVGIVLVVILLAVGIYLQAEIAIANHEYLAARAAFAQDPAVGVSLYVDAFGRFSPYAGREKLTCISLILKSVLAKQQSSQVFDAGSLVSRLSNEAIDSHPQDGASYIALNDMYNNLAFYLNPEFSVPAEAFGKRALELLPSHQAAMYNLGRTYISRNEPARAVELNRRMLRDADFPNGHLYLGLSLLLIDQRDEAKQEIRKTLKMGGQLSTRDLAFLKRHLTDKDISDLMAGK